MGNTILYILLIVAIYTTILNYRMVKRNKNSSGYVKCANALFKGDADAGAQIAVHPFLRSEPLTIFNVGC